MDKQIQKLKQYIKNYLGKTKSEILEELGKPVIISDSNIWIYDRRYLIICKDEIYFLFTNGIVKDIIITEYIFRKPLQNIFYQENQIPEFVISPVKYTS